MTIMTNSSFLPAEVCLIPLNELLSANLHQNDAVDCTPSRLYASACAAAVALLMGVLLCIGAVVSSSLSPKQGKMRKDPPPVPCSIPFLGIIPLGLLLNPRKYVCSSKYAFGSKNPVHVRFLFGDFYILQGKEHINALFRKHSLSAFVVHGSLLRHVFSLPKAAASVYYKDDSGEHPKAHEGTVVEPRNRVDFLTRSSFKQFLTGPGLAPLCSRFEHNITENLQALKVGLEWQLLPDLMDIFQNGVTVAVIDAMCGPGLVERHPNFTRDLWTLDHNVMRLFMRTPRFLAPKAHKARDRALLAVKDWHSWASENFKADSVDSWGDDPYWGTKFFRERQDMFFDMDGFNADAVASQELAFIWGANTNAIISAFWVTLEVFRDPELLQSVRKEVNACIKETSDKNLSFDVPKLLHQPLLQAVFAESLRLRVNGFLIRYSLREDLEINDYSLRQHRFCLTGSTPAHMDPEIWCRGPSANRPVDSFWPGRFLKQGVGTDALEFSLKGTEGSWMPFGGGTHACPGRIFAKLEIILTMAILVTMFDCEVIADKRSMEMSARNFGFGTSAPHGKVPVMIRRRGRV